MATRPALTALTALTTLFILGGCAVEVGRTLPRTIRIGGLFEHEYRGQELVFKYAVEKVNSRRDILPYTKLVYDIQTTPAGDSFTASKKVCRQLREGGVAAVFGPMSAMSASHVQSICDAMEIPHVETRWNFHDNKDTYSINLYPYHRLLSRAYINLIHYWRWPSFTLLYEDNEGLVRLQDLLMSAAHEDFQITVRRLESLDGSYREIFKEIRDRGETHIVIDCDYSNVQRILSEALSINMMNQYYHYLLTTLDIGLIELEDFKYGGTNITAFRLVDPARKQVEDVLGDWIMDEYRNRVTPRDNERGFRTETALTYDAVHLFAKALHDLSRAQNIRTESVSCNKGKPWTYGNSLINYMKMTEFDGLTGQVKFDPDGLRTDFTLDIMEHSMVGLEKVGTWTTLGGVNITKNFTQAKKQIEHDLSNQTLRVTTILEKPYVMWKADHGNFTGNARFEGFCIDLLAEIANYLKFNYTIHLVKDGTYGAKNSSGQWTGMVRELMDKEADLAVASLTISWVREQVIDFTKPFMNLGISILFKRPKKKKVPTATLR